MAYRLPTRFVPHSTIRRHMLRKDLRIQAEARRRAARLPAFLAPEVVPFVDVAIVPVSPDLAPVVEVALAPLTHYIPAFTHRLPNGDQRALCDAFVLASAFSTEPTCRDCRVQLADDAEQLDALRQEVW